MVQFVVDAGTDHAGIATQNVVEKALAEKGVSRHDLGERPSSTRSGSGGKSTATIINQLKRLGASCDWKRIRFTMDEGSPTRSERSSSPSIGRV